MESRWKKHYRPLSERARSVQETAWSILTVLVANTEPLTVKEICRLTGRYELKTRSFLGLLEHESMVDKIPRISNHAEERYRHNTYIITETGQSYLLLQVD